MPRYISPLTPSTDTTSPSSTVSVPNALSLLKTLNAGNTRGFLGFRSFEGVLGFRRCDRDSDEAGLDDRSTSQAPQSRGFCLSPPRQVQRIGVPLTSISTKTLTVGAGEILSTRGRNRWPVLAELYRACEGSLWSVDLFRCESILLRSHWVIVVMDMFTRRIIGFGVERVERVDPCGVSICRMFNQIIAGKSRPRTSPTTTRISLSSCEGQVPPSAWRWLLRVRAS